MSMFAGVKGQEEQRRVETFLDQHGREYVANVEIKTGDPCEVLRPIGWNAPQAPSWFAGQLMPPECYLKLVPRMLRARKGYQIEIDYTRWLTDLDTRDEEYRQKKYDLVRGMAGGADVSALAENPPPVIRDLLGVAPFPPRVLVEAMRAGNKWALGLSETVPAKVTVLLSSLEPAVKRVSRAQDEAIIDPLADDEAEQEERREAVAAFVDPLESIDFTETVPPTPKRRRGSP